MFNSSYIKHNNKIDHVMFIQVNPNIIIKFSYVNLYLESFTVYKNDIERDPFKIRISYLDDMRFWYHNIIKKKTIDTVKMQSKTHFNLFDFKYKVQKSYNENTVTNFFICLNELYKNEFTDLLFVFKETYQEQFISNNPEFIGNFQISHSSGCDESIYNYYSIKQLNEKEFGKCLLFINSSELSMMDVDLEFESNTEEDPQ